MLTVRLLKAVVQPRMPSLEKETVALSWAPMLICAAGGNRVLIRGQKHELPAVFFAAFANERGNRLPVVFQRGIFVAIGKNGHDNLAGLLGFWHFAGSDAPVQFLHRAANCVEQGRASAGAVGFGG